MCCHKGKVVWFVAGLSDISWFIQPGFFVVVVVFLKLNSALNVVTQRNGWMDDFALQLDL